MAQILRLILEIVVTIYAIIMSFSRPILGPNRPNRSLGEETDSLSVSKPKYPDCPFTIVNGGYMEEYQNIIYPEQKDDYLYD